MNIPRRIERVSGYRQTFVEMQPPSAENEVPKDNLEPEHNIDKHYEELKMDEGIAPVSTARALGVDIGTGFISCAELRKRHQEISKGQRRFFQIEPFQISRRVS